MQTFLPYSDFAASAKTLDRARLGKQRVETLQIVKALILPEYGWKNHPAVKIWDGHLTLLYEYQHAICSEWTSRGYKDTCLEKTMEILADENLEDDDVPSWLGDEEFHRSHQSNLIRKLPEHYRPLFPDVPDDLEYVWPL